MVVSPIMVVPGALTFVKVLLLIVRMNGHTCSNLAQSNHLKLLLLQATSHDLASELAAELDHHMRTVFRRICNRGPVIVRAHTIATSTATKHIFATGAMAALSSTSCGTI